MNKTEFRELIEYELYAGKNLNLLGRIRTKYFQPNTNCMYLVRKMYYFASLAENQRSLLAKYAFLRAKFLHIRILRRYGCIFFLNAKIGKGLYIEHPVGIVVGKCEIGENLHIYQGSTIGVAHRGEDEKGLYPHIGNNVLIGSNCAILGNVRIADNVKIGANSVVLHDLMEPGTYAGAPCARVK